MKRAVYDTEVKDWLDHHRNGAVLSGLFYYIIGMTTQVGSKRPDQPAHCAV